ncbi:MAG: PHP domain-containing protein [Clostridia bacterium]|nr:PHP domain-containing protein [Clostridia bacterium]
MLLTADYHTHTPYSHGKGTVLENAIRAKEIGLEQIGITDHGFSHVIFGVRRRQVEKLLSECREAEEKTGIRVILGMENNIRGRSGNVDLTERDFEQFDLFLCGMHLVIYYSSVYDAFQLGAANYLRTQLKMKPTKRLLRDTTNAYINAVKNHPIDVLTHLNYLCFADAVEVAKCCRDYGTYLEISGKKTHLTDEELYQVAQTGVRFVVNSDAHSVDRIGDIALAKAQIDRVGIPYTQIDNIDGRLPVFRLQEYKKRNL